MSVINDTMLKYQDDFIIAFNKVVAEHPDCDYIEIVNTIIDPLKEILMSAEPTPVVEQEDSSDEPEPEPVKEPVKKKSPKKSSAKKTFDSSKYETINYLQENPKKKIIKGEISKSWARYEVYKAATTYDEFIRLGGTNRDLKSDLDKGFISLDGTAPVQKVKPTKVKNDTVKKKIEKIEVNKKVTPKKVKKAKKVKKELSEEPTETDISLSDATTSSVKGDVADLNDFDDVHKEDEDNSWPEKTIDGVSYKLNPSDNMLIDPNNGKQIGYLHSDDDIDDDNIEYIGDGEDLHNENIDKIE